jgi:hypothetical protein
MRCLKCGGNFNSAPAHTQFAEATCGTIRLKLRVGAGQRPPRQDRDDSACPYQNEFGLAHLRLTAMAH